MIHFTKKDHHVIIEVPEKWNQFTVEDFFKDYWKAPKKVIHEWRMSKEVTVNNERVPWSTKLSQGDSS